MDDTDASIRIPEPEFSRFAFSDTRFGWFWLIVRLYAGWQWITAGWEKAASPAWVGSQAGSAIQGFFAGVLKNTAGPHPNVSALYAYFINSVAMPHPLFFSYLITFGELAVGVGLILGALTGIAAFFGTLMNFNFLFAGAVSINPLLIIIQLFLIFAWRNAGWWGFDRFLLPALGVPWQRGTLFQGSESKKHIP